MFQSVLRFQRLLKIAREMGPEKGLGDLAVNAGYADQAHMTREVRRFSGTPPTVLLPSARCALGLSDLVRKTEHMNC